MNKKRKIKVIKKSDMEIAQTPLIEEKSAGKITNRKICLTVSDWVKELQQCHYEETMMTFEQLLARKTDHA